MDKPNALVLWKLCGNGNERTNHACEWVPTTQQLYQVHKNSFAKRKGNDDEKETHTHKQRRNMADKVVKQAESE